MVPLLEINLAEEAATGEFLQNFINGWNGCLSRTIASLVLLMSPLGLDTTTTGLTHGVGPWTGWMISSASSCLNSLSTLPRILNGMHRGDCAIGGTVLSM